MTSEFVSKRLEAMKESIPGYDFYELSKLAKLNPEEFEKKRKQILEAELAKAPDDCREKDRQFVERLLQSRDPYMDIEESIIRSIATPLSGVGDLYDAAWSSVASGTRSVDENLNFSKKEALDTKKELLASFKVIVDGVVSNAEGIKKNSEGILQNEIGIAKIESRLIPDDKKQ